jgi:hypothetical protein
MTISNQQTRRAALGAITCLPALAILPSAVASEPASPSDNLAVDLYSQRHALRQLWIDAAIVADEAEERMPEWALSGPSMLEHDGSRSGQIVGWPAIEGMKPPEKPGEKLLVRPGADDLRRAFEHRNWSPQEALLEAVDHQIAERRAAQASEQLAASLQIKERLTRSFRERPEPKISKADASAIYKKELRELAARVRAQKDERDKAGYTAALALCEAAHEKRCAIDEQIFALPATTPSALAALVLVEISTEIWLDKTVSETFESSENFRTVMGTLSYLRPLLTGLLQSHIVEILDNPSMPAGLLQAVHGANPRLVERSFGKRVAAAA